jgi:hypothetical protein
LGARNKKTEEAVGLRFEYHNISDIIGISDSRYRRLDFVYISGIFMHALRERF